MVVSDGSVTVIIVLFIGITSRTNVIKSESDLNAGLLRAIPFVNLVSRAVTQSQQAASDNQLLAISRAG